MFAWLRRMFGRPTVDDVAALVIARLRAGGAEKIDYSAALHEIRYELGGSPALMNLSNLHHEYASARRAERAACLERYVGGLFERVTNEVPKSYEQARAHLLPILRTRNDDAIGALTAQRIERDGKAQWTPMASKPMPGDFVAGLGYDTAHATQRVTAGMLDDWGVDFERAFDDALQNLRTLPEHGGWTDLGNGVWSGNWGDSYESSRLLLPDLIYRLGIAEPVALAPLRHALLVANARDERALSALAETAQRLLGEHQRWLSCVPLALVDGRWQVFEPPASLAAAFSDLHAIEKAENYSGQKQLLDAIHEERNIDVFVATATLIKAPDDGRLISYSVWSRGVDTLLPHCDLVAMLPDPESGGGATFVAWDDLARVAGHHLEATDAHPPRYRLRTFPSDAELAQLAAVAKLQSGG